MTRISSEVPLNAAQILDLYDAEERRNVELFDTRREASSRAVRHTSRLGGQGVVIYSDLAVGDVEAVVVEQIEYFESIGQDFEWKVYAHDSPSDLGARLAALGFKAEDEETIVCLDLSALPERLAETNTENVERVSDPDGVGEIVSMMESVWQEDAPS
jgi:hypothetical protein